MSIAQKVYECDIRAILHIFLYSPLMLIVINWNPQIGLSMPAHCFLSLSLGHNIGPQSRASSQVSSIQLGQREWQDVVAYRVFR